MMFIYFLFFYPVDKSSIRKSAPISTFKELSISKLDQDGTLERSFFDFPIPYPRKVRKRQLYTMYNGCPGNLYKRRNLYL